MARAIKPAFNLVEEARGRTPEVSAHELKGMLGSPDVVVFDVREQNEREIEGVIPGAVHAPRGMIEFWADPTMDIHRPEFDPSKRIVLHCAMGGRGALAADTLRAMGFPDVASLSGGFAAWKEGGHPIEPASTSPEAPAQRTSRRLRPLDDA